MKLAEKVRQMQADGMTAEAVGGRTILRHRDGRPLDITNGFKTGSTDPLDEGPTYWAIVGQVQMAKRAWGKSFEAWYAQCYPYGTADKAVERADFETILESARAFRHFVGDKRFDVLLAAEDNTNF